MFYKHGIFCVLLLMACSLLSVAHCETIVEAQKQNTVSSKMADQESEKVDVDKVSEAFGYLVGRNLISLGFEFDLSRVIKGLENSVSGVDSPMSEEECNRAIFIMQDALFQKRAVQNLDAANKFMTENAKNEGVVELEKNKLQYKLTREGTGNVVEAHHSPLLKYSGTFLDGKEFAVSQGDEIVSLCETIPGLSQGIMGMKEGEERILYVHPDLGYGIDDDGYVPPNSLLVFNVAVIKADATAAIGEQQAETSPNSDIPEEQGQEIAKTEELFPKVSSP